MRWKIVAKKHAVGTWRCLHNIVVDVDGSKVACHRLVHLPDVTHRFPLLHYLAQAPRGGNDKRDRHCNLEAIRRLITGMIVRWEPSGGAIWLTHDIDCPVWGMKPANCPSPCDRKDGLRA